MKPTLLILAAGMASRYGSMKQTEGFGPSGETIMDYSIYDAIRAGFGKVVFVIREDFAENFMANFEPKLKGKIETEYVFQSLDKLVPADLIPKERTKPWGTGHAVLCAKDVINEPFAIINADDFYGRHAFELAADFLQNKADEHTWAIIGYRLGNTLSDNGTESRGVCEVDKDNMLTSITERTKIYKDGDKAYFEENGNNVDISTESNVSMNFFGFHPNFFERAEKLFGEFVKKNTQDPKAEFFVPLVADDFIKEGNNKMMVIPTTAEWFGVTYKEDAPLVKGKLDKLISDKAYTSNVWAS